MTTNFDTKVSLPPIDYKSLQASNLDFDPIAVVGPLPEKPRRGFLTGFVATTVLFVGFGAGSAVLGDVMVGESVADQQQDLAEAEEAIDTAEARALNSDLELDEISIDIGEGCLALFQRYMPGIPGESDEPGRLVDVSEDSMLDDLLNTPGTPCGDRPSDIREDFRSYGEAVDSKIIDRSNVNQARQLRDDQETQTAGIRGDQNDEQWPNGIVNMLLPGILVGAVVGASVSDDYRKENERVIHDKLDEYFKKRNKERIIMEYEDPRYDRLHGTKDYFDRREAFDKDIKQQRRRNIAVTAVVREHFPAYEKGKG